MLKDIIRSVSGSQKVNAAIKILSATVILSAAFAGICFFKASVPALAVFGIFFFFFILLPGNLIIRSIRAETEHLSTEFIRSFFAGFALNILLYYFSSLIRTDILGFLVAPLLSVLWIIRVLKRRRDPSVRKSVSRGLLKRIPASFFAFAACVFLFSMCATQFKYVAPQYTVYSLIRQDFGFHAGIINALAEGFPPKNPWIDGRIITYHYFSEMLLAIPVRVLNVTSDELLMMCTPYLITPVFCTALYSFFREMAGRSERAGLYCLAFHFSNMFMLKRFTNSWFLYHVYSNVNNAGLGLACLLTTLPLLRDWNWDRDPADSGSASKGWTPGRSHSFLLAAMVMLMTGIKGPVAVVLVCGMAGTLILALIMRRANRRMASATLLSVMSFLIIYIYVLAGDHSNASGGSIFNAWEVTDLFFLKTDLLRTAGRSGLPGAAGYALLLAVFIIFYATAFLIPFVIGYIREFLLVVTKRKDFCFSRITVYASCLAGFAALMLLNFSGHSQVYFGFVSAVLIPVIALWYLEDIQDSASGSHAAVRYAFAAMLCVFSCTMVIYMGNIADSVADYYNSQNEHLEKYRDVSVLEYEGLIWLRDNTPEDSLCASDRFNSVSMKRYDYTKRNNNTHFSYAIYSQRRQYLEGSGFSLYADQNDLRKEMLENNAKLYDASNSSRGEDAKALGVDYVIVSKRFNDYGDLSGCGYELCYTNEDMDIFEVY